MAATKACRPQEENSGQGSKGCYAVMHYMQSKILGCIVSYELFGNNIPTSLSVWLGYYIACHSGCQLWVSDFVLCVYKC